MWPCSAGFVVVQTRVPNPVLPLRVILDRNRGGSYLGILSLGIGLFGMFLFLTYYLQGTLGFSAVDSGLAFLPMTGALVITAQLAVNVLARRVGPRYIIAPGLAIAAIGLVMLAHLDINSSYAANVLPATIIFGLGAGLTFSSATANATARVKVEDAGVASAMVSTGQQVGGSVGTALLSTLAASAASQLPQLAHRSPSRRTGHHPQLHDRIRMGRRRRRHRRPGHRGDPARQRHRDRRERARDHRPLTTPP